MAYTRLLIISISILYNIISLTNGWISMATPNNLQCFIGKNCKKAEQCCAYGVDVIANGFGCQRDTNNKKYVVGHSRKNKCCLQPGFIGCTKASHCCGKQSKCSVEGICTDHRTNINPTTTMPTTCRANGKCDRTEDCCSDEIWVTGLGLTCSYEYKQSMYWYNGDKSDEGCCIKMGYKCAKDIQCCNKKGSCYEGICVNKENIAKTAWFDMSAMDNAVFKNINAIELNGGIKMLLLGLIVVMISLCMSCTIYVYTDIQKREAQRTEAVDVDMDMDELSTVAHGMEWGSIMNDDVQLDNIVDNNIDRHIYKRDNIYHE